jgi:hypothetical protein
MMLRHCLFCGRFFSGAERLSDLPAGVRIAFDPLRGRIWTVCDRCHGWNLWLAEDRGTLLDRLERVTATRARLLWQTDNVALLESDARELIRIGKTDLREEAWWRYGRALRRRHGAYQSQLSRLGAATYAAVSYVGTSFGLSRLIGDFRQEDDVYAGVLRWRRFGGTAWSGRAPCPRCHSVLLKLFFFKSRSLILLPRDGPRVAVGLPCARCDPWTIDKVHRFEGVTAEHVLRRVLAYLNIDGASGIDLDAAARIVRSAGSAQQLIRALSAKRTSLARLGRAEALALEISVNHAAESRLLELEALGIEAAWRQAEELAGIIDDELR